MTGEDFSVFHMYSSLTLSPLHTEFLDLVS
jgi:hypothetical protein